MVDKLISICDLLGVKYGTPDSSLSECEKVEFYLQEILKYLGGSDA